MTISQIIRNVGKRLGLAVPAPRPSVPSKAAIAKKFNAAVDQLQKQGWKAEQLPPKMTPEVLKEYKAKELQHIAKAMETKGKQKTKYGTVQPKATSDYEHRFTDVINARREKIRERISNIPTTVKNEETGMVRGQMGDVRADEFQPLKRERSFKSQAEEAHYLQNLAKAGTNYKMEVYKSNLIQTLYTEFGDEAMEIIAMIEKASAEKVMDAYYKEELFSIGYIYEESEKPGLISVLKQALLDSDITVPELDEKEIKEIREKAIGLVEAHDQRELLKQRMLGRA